MPANFNCLLLDVDGTLLDFKAGESAAIAATLESFELPCDDATCALYSEINAELWQQLERGEIKKDTLSKRRFSLLLQRLEEKRDPIRMNNEFLTRLSQEAQIIPGADELLAELAEFATLAAVTNGIHRAQVSRLEKSGLLPYFDGVFSSEKMGSSKPNRRCFDIPLRQLGINNREKVLVVGDSLGADVKGGKNAGLATCWCNFAGLDNETGIEPDYTVKSFAELKLVAVGEEELALAAAREKRHMV